MLAALAVAPAAPAQVEIAGGLAEQPPAPQLQPQARKQNRLGLSTRFGFNISAEFRNIGGVVSNPGPDPVQDPGFAGLRTYDDGFVGQDVTYPNNGGVTAYWGYQDSSQVEGDQIFFHSASPAMGAESRVNPDQVPLGFEFTYARELQRNDYGSWGLELGAGWTYLSVRDNRTLSGQVTAVRDAYFLGNPPPALPVPPFSGTPDGTDYAVIGSTPTRAGGTVPGTVTGQRHVSANLYSFRVGPYFDWRLTPKTSVQGGVGAAAVLVDGRFSYTEATATSLGTLWRTGQTSDVDVRFGPYLMAQFITEFHRQTFAFAGVQFYMLGEVPLTAASKEVRLQMDQALFVHAGLGFSF